MASVRRKARPKVEEDVAIKVSCISGIRGGKRNANLRKC
jgi:hypothetical protein